MRSFLVTQFHGGNSISQRGMQNAFLNKNNDFEQEQNILTRSHTFYTHFEASQTKKKSNPRRLELEQMHSFIDVWSSSQNNFVNGHLTVFKIELIKSPTANSSISVSTISSSFELNSRFNGIDGF